MGQLPVPANHINLDCLNEYCLEPFNGFYQASSCILIKKRTKELARFEICLQKIAGVDMVQTL